MHPLTLTIALLLYSLPSVLGQYFFPRNPPGCQYPSLSDGAFIYFSTPTDLDTSLQYVVSTPWTRFYPDALRADLAQEGFQLSSQRGTNQSDACGWTFVETVKKHGWHHGDISFRHVPSGGVKVVKATTTPATMAVHLVNVTGRATPMKPQVHSVHRSNNATLGRIRNVLEANSPEADILFMMLEITLPIMGVIGFITLMLLVTRYLTNKFYPNSEEDEEAGDIELSSVGSDDTCVDTRRPELARVNTDQRFYNGGIVRIKPALPRKSSSLYSRSMDGVTLYPKEVTGSWD
ncbi:hypothetical protein N0V90_001994 [Kalmusia sp. IMI 367209]|nr:hypothetical protein N0V90_001994 [Kalmusia sp. IMI 367209]